jgi:putative flippase GtrA
LIRHFLSRQFLAFLAVGGTAALANWFSRMLIGQWLSFSWSVIAAYAVGMTVAFLLNSVFVFPGSDKSWQRQAFGFAAVNFAFAPVVWAASLLLERGLMRAGMIRHTQPIAHGVAVLIPAVATFLIYKLVVFRGARR